MNELARFPPGPPLPTWTRRRTRKRSDFILPAARSAVPFHDTRWPPTHWADLLGMPTSQQRGYMASERDATERRISVPGRRPWRPTFGARLNSSSLRRAPAFPEAERVPHPPPARPGSQTRYDRRRDGAARSGCDLAGGAVSPPPAPGGPPPSRLQLVVELAPAGPGPV